MQSTHHWRDRRALRPPLARVHSDPPASQTRSRPAESLRASSPAARAAFPCGSCFTAPGGQQPTREDLGVLLAPPAGMHMRPLLIAIIGLLLAWPAASRAQDEASDPPEIGFVEAE